MHRFLISSFLILTLGSSARATIVGHEAIDGVESLPQATMDTIGQQRWLFCHASVGVNIISGMNWLHTQDPGRYQLTFSTAGDGSQILPPPPATLPGTVYDGARGNPGWAQKFAMFDDAVRNLGWRYPLLDAAMDKLCYIDESAEVSVYLTTLTALEGDFPATVFVYTTMPLQSGQDMDWANILATNYNHAVRQHCAGNDRLLFDIADIECHDPAGNAVTFTYEGQTYERLYSGYTNDGGHLNSTGARRMARGWYAAAARLADPGTPVPEAVVPAAGITSIAPNPFNPTTVIRFRLERSAPVDLALFDLRGRLVDRLVATRLDAGEHAVTWRGTDAPAGVYLAHLRVEGMTSVRKLTLVR